MRTFVLAIVMIGAALQGATASAPAGVQPDGSVIDAAGRTFRVEQPFSRIISLYGAHTEVLLALGLDRQIIGVSRLDGVFPWAETKPVFSYQEDPEKILAARPDLVLVRPMVERGYGPLLARLEQSGIAVASFQPASVDQMYPYWAALGRLTGRQGAAACLIEGFQLALNDLASLRAQIQNPQQVFFEAIHSKMKTFTPQAMAGFALAQAGGINIATDARQVRDTNIAFYGREQILAKGETIDVYLAQYGTMNPVTVDQIKRQPGFRAIKAVRQNRVYTIDEMLVSRPSPRLLEGIYQIGAILYPDIFTEAVRRRIHLDVDCRGVR